MKKGIYSHYKERLIEIGGNNKCLFLRSSVRKGTFDIGRIFEGRGDKISEFTDFLWTQKKHALTLISNKEKKPLLQNLDIHSKLEKRMLDTTTLSGDELEKAERKNEKAVRDEGNRAVENEIEKLKFIQRDSEEIEKETGRAELYIGYPFVFGMINQGGTKTMIKAPLLLFPVKINIPDESTVELQINPSEKIQFNRSLIFAYAQSRNLKIDKMELEFDDLSSFSSVTDIMSYLESFDIKIDNTGYESRNIFSLSRFKDPEAKRGLYLRYAAVLTRFPIYNSIFNDYSALQKKNLTNDGIAELLRIGKVKKSYRAKLVKASKKHSKEAKNYYPIKSPDFAQSEVIKSVEKNGNMVIYGPPGTGKSQTIVNIIADALCKSKRVLVISQKKAALDVVYNRLGNLNEKAMYITDETKEKKKFYERCLSAHKKAVESDSADTVKLLSDYSSLQEKINADVRELDGIYNALNTVRPFGISLWQMYSDSTMIQKNSTDYGIYQKMLESREIMDLKYDELCDALSDIKEKNLESLYYNFMQDKAKNPIIDHMRKDVDIQTLSEIKGVLAEIQKSRKGLFNTAKYPYYRQVLAYYYDLNDEENLDYTVKLELKLKKRRGESVPTFASLKQTYVETLDAIDDYSREYACLKSVMTLDGYLAVIDNLLRGNTAYMRYVNEALENYIALRDVNTLLESLNKNKQLILNFAYSISKTYQNFVYIISKFLEIRIYHEVVTHENSLGDELGKSVDFNNITSRISRNLAKQLELAGTLCAGKIADYEKLYENSADNKDYLYQISKKKNFWPIKKAVEVYKDFILKLFPCWLLSPENVSNLLPLTKNLFDLVIFDEASQVFIESTIPAIYRGKNIVVAGDSKQLRPSTTFMKRYMGAEPETQDDYATQAALEVESLLDLAVARYESANLTYHYRSRYQELIDFSNHAFYSLGLQVAPNITKAPKTPPIERIKVSGKWIDRKNVNEAKKVIEILKDIFATRRHNESIGIITFNADQQTCIADLIDKECLKDTDFRSHITKEKHRYENGEDTSIFVKNLENVQGDERDIIIFSIGYAQNEQGKIYTNFGSLSADGGENRLNVAITRAKSKIYVVTSIEPEALKVENSKNLGPKLLQKYLMYVRAVSEGDKKEVRAILSEFNSADTPHNQFKTTLMPTDAQIKEKLEKSGYSVDMNLGNGNSKISLAIYDEKSDDYLLGIELDKDAFQSSPHAMERDVSKRKFLESRGWKIIRVWSRDWWLYPNRVLKTIISEAEKNRENAKKKA